MKDIPVNAAVECADGPCGESIAVIINPVTQTVTHLVVLDQTLPSSTQRLVPVEQVADTTSVSVRLHCTKEELSQMEPFTEEHFVLKEKPGYSMWHGGEYEAPITTTVSGNAYDVTVQELIPPGELAVHRGDAVEATDGPVGAVGEFTIDPASGHISHLVLLEGHLWGKEEVTVPVSAIDDIRQGTVYLKLDKEAIELLPAIPVKRHYSRGKAGDTRIELVAKIFDEPGKAKQALEHVKELQTKESLKILNAAILVKEKDGQTSLKETEDVEPKQGRLFGAVTGGLIGLLTGGPVGAVVGALAGAGTGGLAAKWIDMGFSDKFLKNLQDHLQPGSSALILLVEHEWAAKAFEALADQEGIILQQTLTDEIAAQLLEASEAEE